MKGKEIYLTKILINKKMNNLYLLACVYYKTYTHSYPLPPLQAKTRGMIVKDERVLQDLAEDTKDFSGAELENLVQKVRW